MSDNYFLYPQIIVIYDYVHIESTVLIKISRKNELHDDNINTKPATKRSLKRMQRCQHGKFGNCLTHSIFLEKSRSTCFLPKVFLQSTNTILFPHKNKSNDTNKNIEFGAKILWKIMQWCRHGIIYKLPNSLQKQSRSTHFWPTNCPGPWHFWVSSMSEKERIVGIVQVTKVFLRVLGCFLSICTIISCSFDIVLEVIVLICLS